VNKELEMASGVDVTYMRMHFRKAMNRNSTGSIPDRFRCKIISSEQVVKYLC
jgi:hypothetical protein